MSDITSWSCDAATPTRIVRPVKSVTSDISSPVLSSSQRILSGRIMSGVEAYHLEALRRQRVLNRSAHGNRTSRPATAATPVCTHPVFTTGHVFVSVGLAWSPMHVYLKRGCPCTES